MKEADTDLHGGKEDVEETNHDNCEVKEIPSILKKIS